MRTATKLLTLFGSTISPPYLVRDQFTTNLSAGSVNGTLAEPGPGTRTVVDSGNHLSIASNRVVASAAAANDDPILHYGGRTPQAGLTAKWTLRFVTLFGASGWVLSATPGGVPTLGFQRNAANTIVPVPPNGGGDLVVTANVDYTAWACQFAQGGALFLQGGSGTYTYTNPTLLWVDDAIVWGSTCYFMPVIAQTAGLNTQVDNVEITVQPALSNAAAMAIVNISNPASGVGYATVTDPLIYLAVSLVTASMANGDYVEIRYRVVDANNYWRLHMEKIAGTLNLSFGTVTAGVVDTPVAAFNVSSGITDLAIRCVGSAHSIFTRASGTWTKRTGTTSATFNTGTEVDVYKLNTSPTKLLVFPTAWTLS